MPDWKKGEHYQIAQLILWREDPQSEDGKEDNRQKNDPFEESGDDYVFRAALSGSSGPATLALATLFVDERKKEETFGKEYYLYDDKGEKIKKPDDRKRYPLCLLQKTVRSLLVQEYLKRLAFQLGKEFEEDVNAGNSIKNERIMTLTSAYLSTVLYRYFFPFLTKEDEARICNGVEYYIRSMMTENSGLFTRQNALAQEHVDKLAKIVVDTLRITLKSLCALEIFYKVKVSFDGAEGTDSRKTHYITILPKSKPKNKNEEGQAEEKRQSAESNDYYIRCMFQNRTN